MHSILLICILPQAHYIPLYDLEACNKLDVYDRFSFNGIQRSPKF